MLPRVILVLLGLVAQALGLPADQADPTQWGSLALASGFTWALTEYLRAYAFKNWSLDGLAVHLVAVVAGIAVGISLGFANVVPGGLTDWALFGVQAALGATVLDVTGKTAIKSLAKARAA